MELNKYFLLGYYEKDLNVVNPLGLGGRLAKTYAHLMTEMWQGIDKNERGGLAPYDLKLTLGGRV